MIQAKERLVSLDYLRGFAALGIMIYHYSTWSFGKFDSETLLGKIGIYGVSIFYVLSGLTLYKVYYNKMKSTFTEIADFYVKRFFRIFPLLWVVTIITFVLSRSTNWYQLFLNLTGLFGFIDWSGHIAIGAWSIGNELVFYLFFPIFIFLSKWSKTSLFILSFFLLVIYMAFAFYFVSPNLSISQQKNLYMHPLNQVFLFLGGFLIGYFFDNKYFPVWKLMLIMILALAVFIFWPVYGDMVNLIVGMPRIVLTCVCIVVCFCFLKMRFILPNFANKVLARLGEATYSIYLLHPIIWSLVLVVSKRTFQLNKPFQIAVSISITLFVSYICYSKFETFFIGVGKKASKSLLVSRR
jgi:exopolysaccharide production protein ExoZ